MTWMFIKGLVVGWVMGSMWTRLRIKAHPASRNYRWN